MIDKQIEHAKDYFLNKSGCTYAFFGGGVTELTEADLQRSAVVLTAAIVIRTELK